MIKFLLLLLIPYHSYGWINPESFDSSYLELEEGLSSDHIRNSVKSAKGKLSSHIVESILHDKRDLVAEDFNIPDYFYDSVYFWFSIYSQFSSEQVVIHDANDLNIIYNVIDFSEMFDSNLDKFAKANLKNRLTLEYTRKLKKILRALSTANFTKLNSEQFDILQALKKSKSKIPKSSKKRKVFFHKLARSIRTQSGQRNKIYHGIIRSTPYYPFLNAKLKLFDHPKEILAIPFLESSFNPKAISKVDAAGIWQFMEYTNNLFMPKKTRYLDYRKNPFISTLGAFHLLKENKLILRRWDMAITAYNSGTNNLVKARKKYRKRKNLDLAYVLDHYKSKSLGFASKNFYSEFLALAHVLAYKEIIYPLKGLEEQMQGLDSTINIYIAKCSIKPSYLFSLLKQKSPHIEELNQHFLKPKHKFPRGTLIVSDTFLSPKYYFKLSPEQLKSVFPKKYAQYIRQHKCGKLP